jgi:hypothetical protein
MLWLGLSVLTTAVVMFFIGLPRHGQPSFIGATETRGSVFAVLFVGMLLIGISFIVWSFN